MKKLLFILFIFLMPVSVYANTLSLEEYQYGKFHNIDTNIVNHETFCFNQLKSDLDRLKKSYYFAFDYESIGKSLNGRDIYLMKIGHGKEKILLVGAHHAREFVTSTALVMMAENYLKGYYFGFEYKEISYKEILNKCTIYIVPMVNPDGVVIASEEKEDEIGENVHYLKNQISIYKSNANGVDLNRNYDLLFDKRQVVFPYPAYIEFKGYAPHDQLETQAIVSLCEREDFSLAMSYHTKGEVIYWADSYTMYDEEIDYLATEFSKETGYRKMPVSSNEKTFAGGFENWFRAKYDKPSFCIEFSPYNGTDLPYQNNQIYDIGYDKIKNSGLFFAYGIICKRSW